MNSSEILATLQELGRPQIAAIHMRHGSGENVFGTLTSELVRFRKKIGVNHQIR